MASDESPKPVLVSVRDARRMLANMSHNRFWELAAQGEFEITGTRRKRQVFVRSIESYAERQPRAEYSRPSVQRPHNRVPKKKGTGRNHHHHGRAPNGNGVRLGAEH